MAKVNLDALIKREDFEAIGQANVADSLFPSIGITQFQSGLLYPLLRKPDFQRETNEWDKKKICDFLESFSSGDLIPSIILWRSSSGFYFVIDGSHRLSALISWINDDYGDGEISQRFYEANIPEEQKNIAEDTRRLINRKIGSYKDIMQALIKNENSKHIEIAKGVSAYVLQVQWVRGDVKKAEQSFFKINQQGVPINNTEIKLLESRRKGNSIASRAIKSGGKGHKYWMDFSAENQNSIQELSKEINSMLFTPPVQSPVKTIDLPIAGKISSAKTLPLILDFINITNNIPIDFKSRIEDDKTGEMTILYLRNARKMAWRINSNHPSSLGLHPIVYFYSLEGNYRPAAFYAIIQWIMKLDQKGKFNDFIKIRFQFESLLIKYGDLISEITRHYRYAIKAYPHIQEFYSMCLDLLLSGKDIDETISEITKNTSKFNFLKIDTEKYENILPNFTTEKKSAVFIREALNNPVRCKICNGLIHQNSITIDHITRKQDGGIGSLDNGQLAHPYCNTTYKN